MENKEKFFFEYLGTSIETRFKLTEEQDEALKFLIDNILSNERFKDILEIISQLTLEDVMQCCWKKSR